MLDVDVVSLSRANFQNTVFFPYNSTYPPCENMKMELLPQPIIDLNIAFRIRKQIC
jgi:hypothetical protein